MLDLSVFNDGGLTVVFLFGTFVSVCAYAQMYSQGELDNCGILGKFGWFFFDWVTSLVLSTIILIFLPIIFCLFIILVIGSILASFGNAITNN